MADYGYGVFEVFKRDGKRHLLYTHKDRFDCECWATNHGDCTTALRKGWSYIQIEKL